MSSVESEVSVINNDNQMIINTIQKKWFVQGVLWGSSIWSTHAGGGASCEIWTFLPQHTHSYIHIHIICNYNSWVQGQQASNRERVQETDLVGTWTPYCFRPRIEAPPRVYLILTTIFENFLSLFNRMYITRIHTHRGIVRSNNFNGSRERISFVRRRE